MVQYSLTVRLKDQYGNYVAGEVSVFKDTTAIISYAPASYGTWVKPLDAGTYTVRAYYPQVTRTQTQETMVTLDRDKTITFTFTAPAPPPPVYHVLTIKSTAGGRTSPIAAPYRYAEGTTVPVTAMPEADYAFDHWNLDGVNVGKGASVIGGYEIRVLMDADHTLEAVFVYSPPTPPPPPPPTPPPTPIEYILTITTTLGGTTDPAPGQYRYAEGSMASVTAIPQQDYIFDHWNLDGANIGAMNPISVSMNTNHTLEAVFTYSPPGPPPVAPPVAAPPEEVPPTVIPPIEIPRVEMPPIEIIPGIPAPPAIIPPPAEAPPLPIAPETAGLIVLGAVAVVIVIGVAVWYFTKPS